MPPQLLVGVRKNHQADNPYKTMLHLFPTLLVAGVAVGIPKERLVFGIPLKCGESKRNTTFEFWEALAVRPRQTAVINPV